MSCARSSTWRRPRRPPPVRSSADALEVVALAMSRPPRAETIAFVLDDAGYGTTVLIVDGTDEPDAVVDVVDRIAAAAGLAGAASIVVATVRPQPLTVDRPSLDDGDVDRWFEASDVATGHGVELLEWYVIGPDGIVCPREVFGERSRWPVDG